VFQCKSCLLDWLGGRLTRQQQALSALLFCVALGPELVRGAVNDRPALFGVAGIAGVDVLNGEVQDAEAYGLLDKFREVAFLHPARAEISTQGEVGFLGDLDVPAPRQNRRGRTTRS
jgi:hypothetical protein